MGIKLVYSIYTYPFFWCDRNYKYVFISRMGFSTPSMKHHTKTQICKNSTFDETWWRAQRESEAITTCRTMRAQRESEAITICRTTRGPPTDIDIPALRWWNIFKKDSVDLARATKNKRTYLQMTQKGKSKQTMIQVHMPRISKSKTPSSSTRAQLFKASLAA